MGENMSKRNPYRKIIRNPIFRATIIPAAKQNYKRKKVSVDTLLKQEGECDIKQEGEGKRVSAKNYQEEYQDPSEGE